MATSNDPNAMTPPPDPQDDAQGAKCWRRHAWGIRGGRHPPEHAGNRSNQSGARRKLLPTWDGT
eukprot:1505464-Alexandrium_andersonii.AAC.1